MKKFCKIRGTKKVHNLDSSSFGQFLYPEQCCRQPQPINISVKYYRWWILGTVSEAKCASLYSAQIV